MTWADMDMGCRKYKNQIDVIMLSFLFFLHEFVSYTDINKYIWQLPLLVACFFYGIYIAAKDGWLKGKWEIKLGLLWYLLFAVELVVYGLFVLQVTEIYSKGYHLLSMLTVISMVLLIYDMRDDLSRLLAKSAIVCIALQTVAILIYDRNELIASFAAHQLTARIGVTMFFGVIETSIGWFILSIPLLYRVFRYKEWKLLAPLFVLLVMLFLTGSKTGILGLFITVMLMLLGVGETRKKRMRLFIGYVAFVALVIAICYFVPSLNQNVFSRFAEVADQIVNPGELDLRNSTSRRIHFGKMAFEMSWNSPVYGHGLFAFTRQGFGWDEVEDTFVNSHTNYTEILYSFGLIGFAIYYWFPVYTLVNAFRCKDSAVKMLVIGTIAGLLFIDFGNISFYFGIIQFVAYPILYFIVRTYGKEQSIEEKRS